MNQISFLECKRGRETVLCMAQWLPIEELYAPAINIYVRDNRQFGRKPIVGVHAVKSLQPYRCQPAVASTELDSDKPSTPGRFVHTPL